MYTSKMRFTKWLQAHVEKSQVIGQTGLDAGGGRIP